MKMMFSTNASKGEKIPATSTRCFDSLPTLSPVPPVASRWIRFLVASRTGRFIPLSVRFWTNRPKVWFREVKYEPPTCSRQLTHDLRLSRDFSWHERWRMTLIGEVFNLFNIGNLLGRSGDLLNPGFGQATSRVTRVFGSGGPRSFQLAARLSF